MRLGVLVALIAISVACGKGAGSEAPRPKEVTDAAKLIELGQCEPAATKLRAYTSANPESFDGFLVLGDALVCACYDPAAKTPRGMRDPAKCKEALASYESALRLRTDSVPALVSAGAVALMLDDAGTAATHLESAVTRDPANTAAANLLAFTKRSSEDDQGYALLERHYAGRQPSSVTPPTIESLCGTSLQCGPVVLLEPVTQKDAPSQNVSISQDDPPPPEEENGEDGSGGTGTAMILDQGGRGGKGAKRAEGQGRTKKATGATLPKPPTERTYGVGTVIDDATLDDEHIAFTDRVFPELRGSEGWVFDSVHRYSFHWQRRSGLEGATVLARRPPEEPMRDTSIMTAAHETSLAWDRAWGAWGCGASGCLFERDIPSFEARLGPVANVAAGSVKAIGEPVNVARTGSMTFIRVTFQEKIFSARRLPTKSVAVVRGGDAARIAKSTFLSLAEKRSVLAGQLWKGAPLSVSVRARKYKLRDASLSLREGRVTLRFENDGQVETYDGGECEVPVNPSPR